MHAFFGADENERRPSHISGDDHGLAKMPVDVGKFGMARRECPRGTLTMHHQLSFFSVYNMFLYLGDIVCHIVNETHAEQARRNLEERDKCLARPMHKALPVRPCVV